jgi:hypothetical protein
MSLSPEELKKSLFSPATITKKSPKRRAYDPINHVQRVYDYSNGTYSNSFAQTQTRARGPSPESEPFASVFRSSSQPARSFLSRTGEMALSSSVSKPVSLDAQKIYQRIYDYESASRIAGALRKPVMSVAYVNPFAIKV